MSLYSVSHIVLGAFLYYCYSIAEPCEGGIVIPSLCMRKQVQRHEGTYLSSHSEGQSQDEHSGLGDAEGGI